MFETSYLLDLLALRNSLMLLALTFGFLRLSVKVLLEPPLLCNSDYEVAICCFKVFTDYASSYCIGDGV